MCLHGTIEWKLLVPLLFFYSSDKGEFVVLNYLNEDNVAYPPFLKRTHNNFMLGFTPFFVLF